MEKPRPLVTNNEPQTLTIAEKCRECKGNLVQDGDDLVCTTCGVVARREQLVQEPVPATRRADTGQHLGSYLGPITDTGSPAGFNGTSTVGYIKLVSDHMGEDSTTWNCSATIERVAEKLSLPIFVRDNAIALSRRILRDTTEKAGPRGRRWTTVPTISAYSLLCACRSAGINRVSVKSIVHAHADLGHRVRRSKLLRLGIESRVPLLPADPARLLQTVISGLGENAAVAKRLGREGVELGPYFRSLLQTSQAIVSKVRGQTGSNPRTVAASCVYLASRELRPKAITQKDAADTVGLAEYTIREFSAWARNCLSSGE